MNYQAQLDGFTLEILDTGTTDDFEKNLGVYERPFSTGAKLDPMGIKRRSTRYTCIFRNDNYDSHEFFVQHLLLDQLNTLIHPVYGPITGAVKAISVRNTSRKRYAEIDIEFIQSASDTESQSYTPDIKYRVEQNLISTQQEQMDQFSETVHAALGPSAQSVLSPALTSDGKLLSQFTHLTFKAHQYISKVDAVVSVLNGSMATIENSAESIIAAVDYGTSLPGVVIGSIARCVERYAQAAVQVSQSPLSFVNNFRVSVAELIQSVAVLKSEIKIAAVQLESLFVADLYNIDDENRVVLDRVENSTIWNRNGTMNGIGEIPKVLSINELESSLKMVREDIQSVIDTIRLESGSSELIAALKEIAASLLYHIDTIKLQREKIISIDLDITMPVHALCVRYGLPYLAAERFMAINNFWNPSFCSGKVNVYVR